MANASVSPTERRIQEILAPRLQVHPEHVPVDLALLDELGLESFEVVEAVLEIERIFAPATIADHSGDELRTIREVAACVDRQRHATRCRP